MGFWKGIKICDIKFQIFHRFGNVKIFEIVNFPVAQQEGKSRAAYKEPQKLPLFKKLNNGSSIFGRKKQLFNEMWEFVFFFSVICAEFFILQCVISRRLHCSRNYLHMHLFVSSIMRCLMSILKDILYLNAGFLFIDKTSDAQGLQFQISTVRNDFENICSLMVHLFLFFNYVQRSEMLA